MAASLQAELTEFELYIPRLVTLDEESNPKFRFVPKLWVDWVEILFIDPFYPAFIKAYWLTILSIL